MQIHVLNEWVVIPSGIAEGDGDRDGAKKNRDDDDEIISFRHRPFAIPRSTVLFPETAEIHRVGDEFNSVERGKDERNRDASEPAVDRKSVV